ncbi:heme-binding protein [Dyadobacter frigoris]|uniref:Heme-binding protein n=1 Tax=Dyadobacter frigoris TaxID=2576211 RepID=A0A4U6D7U1_9BACT|nr:heme-binding protein [Dyadobacter frigoris]TKT92605.1 heme-binding protein [Dyadobacter frigoris]GLU51491.1 hypothetical protein Dfri01_09520 [Dyadobacter frigoris]
MKKLTFSFYCLISLSVVNIGFAQGPPRGGTPASMDLATAKSLTEATVTAAKAANANVAISIVDANGDLVYFERMDGAISMAVTSSQGKARAAILFGIPTKTAAEAAAAGTALNAKITPSGAGSSAIAVQQGGLPIMKDGKIIGGIGVGGSSPGNDEAFAQKALDGQK